MAKRTIDELKAEFETGDRPIWLNFRDLIDTCHNALVRELYSPNGDVKLQVELNGIRMLGDVEVNIIYAAGYGGVNTVVSGTITAPNANLHNVPFVANLNSQTIKTLNNLHVESVLKFNKDTRKEIGSSANRFNNADSKYIETCITVFKDNTGTVAADSGTTVAIGGNNNLTVIE